MDEKYRAAQKTAIDEDGNPPRNLVIKLTHETKEIFDKVRSHMAAGERLAKARLCLLYEKKHFDND